ncbi:hypothetical protein [Dyadobacter sp. 3J3]|uniref:hypothetical protein n=1 Tax=Dyadobacter sp. 3J3 TaxID=2606600 RepID=UPI001E64FD55|nr:hypothetical protein [Dyadobacter sp. 3J3]
MRKVEKISFYLSQKTNAGLVVRNATFQNEISKNETIMCLTSGTNFATYVSLRQVLVG